MDILAQLSRHRVQLQKLESRLGDASVLSHTETLRLVNEEYLEEKKIVEIGERYEKTVRHLNEARQTFAQTNDPELKTLAQEEIDQLSAALPALEQELMQALIPPDPMDKKNIIVEIRAGAGGDEASLFAAELMRMYSMYAEKRGWKTDLISANRNDVGGIKEVVFEIKGLNAYSHLKFESGVHRVQRVPETEKQGRVHTSTATVAILPEVEDVDVKINPQDLKMETTTASGHGGQSVNTTYSAVRITHLPTGIMVYCQEERSQKQNRERGLSIIRARVYALEQERAHKQRGDARRDQIGTGDRSEKIRTYNFPQDRITDHRMKENFHNIHAIMDGGLEEIIQTLKQKELQERLQSAAASF